MNMKKLTALLLAVLLARSNNAGAQVPIVS